MKRRIKTFLRLASIISFIISFGGVSVEGKLRLVSKVGVPSNEGYLDGFLPKIFPSIADVLTHYGGIFLPNSCATAAMSVRST
jgi:hypothetical protein